MNILYIIIAGIQHPSQKGVYTDLARDFAAKGHNIYMAVPADRREEIADSAVTEGGVTLLRIKTLNNIRVLPIEKALAMVSTPFLLERGIIKNFLGVKFDLIVYGSPPVTLHGTVKRLKNRYSAKTYLMLKDIWPQTAADLGAASENSVSFKYLRLKERALYSVSDYIGCMSQGAVEYVLKNNPEVPRAKMEVCPNAIEPEPYEPLDESEKAVFRARNNIPPGALVLAYGGSLNKPQGIPFLLSALGAIADDPRFFVFLCGSGTEYGAVSNWISRNNPRNVKLFPYLPKEEYFSVLQNSDAGLVFLDPRFKFPNIPSRTLDYLQFSLPVLAAVNATSDYHDLVHGNGFGLSCNSDDLPAFLENLEKMLDFEFRTNAGRTGYDFFLNNWTADKAGEIILSHFV